MVGEIFLPGVARDKGKEVGGAAVALGSENATEPLRLLPARTEHPGHLDEHVGVREVDGEVSHLGEHEAGQLVPAKLVIDSFAFGLGGLPAVLLK